MNANLLSTSCALTSFPLMNITKFVFILAAFAICLSAEEPSNRLTVAKLLGGIKTIEPPSLVSNLNGLRRLVERGLTLTNHKGEEMTIMRLGALTEMIDELTSDDKVLLLSHIRDPDCHTRYVAAWLLNSKLRAAPSETFHIDLIQFCYQKNDAPFPAPITQWLHSVTEKIFEGSSDRKQ